MNNEAQNLDSLRRLVRELQDENTQLKELLKKADIPYPEKHIFELKLIKPLDPNTAPRYMKYVPG